VENIPFHEYIDRSAFVSGANTNVPIPDPLTAIPVANDRRFSKQKDTATMLGKYAMPRPSPTTLRRRQQ